MGVYVLAKFKVSSIILTSFRKGCSFTHPPPQNEPLKSPPRLGINLKVNQEIARIKLLLCAKKYAVQHQTHFEEIHCYIFKGIKSNHPFRSILRLA